MEDEQLAVPLERTAWQPHCVVGRTCLIGPDDMIRASYRADSFEEHMDTLILLEAALIANVAIGDMIKGS